MSSCSRRGPPAAILDRRRPASPARQAIDLDPDPSRAEGSPPWSGSVGPPCIFVVETKSLKGKLSINGGEIYVDGHRKTAMLDEVKREALAVQVVLADEIEANGFRVTPLICVHRADLPWFRSEAGGVRLVSGKELVKRLRKADPVLSPADVQRLACLADARLKPAFVAPTG
jgi:hypothetical protein